MTQRFPTPSPDKKTTIAIVGLAIYCAIIAVGIALTLLHLVRQWAR